MHLKSFYAAVMVNSKHDYYCNNIRTSRQSNEERILQVKFQGKLSKKFFVFLFFAACGHSRCQQGERRQNVLWGNQESTGTLWSDLHWSVVKQLICITKLRDSLTNFIQSAKTKTYRHSLAQVRVSYIIFFESGLVHWIVCDLCD